MPGYESGHQSKYLAYVVLAVLFAVSVTNEIRNLSDGLGVLLNPTEHVRDPFEINGPSLGLTSLEPEARAAGIKDGDLIESVRDRPLVGFTNLYSIFRQARPGERLRIQVHSSAPDSTEKDVSVELQPALPAGPKTSDWLSFAIAAMAMPLLCIALGFWVAVVRIHDRQAWLLLAVLLSFAQFFGVSGGYDSLYGREGMLQPVFAAYHIFFANLASAALLLFAVYFPERLDFDRRFPWVKWFLVGPLVFQVATNTMIFSLQLHHIVLARRMRHALGFTDDLQYLHLVAVVLCFAILAYKTLTASGRDARRRLDTAAAVSVTPIIAWLTLRNKLVLPEWTTLLAIVLWFLFPLTMAYVIVVHRAMDVRVVIRQGLRYLLATGGVRVFQIAISILIVVGAATMSADRTANLPRRIALISAGFVLLACTRFFAERLRRWVDRRFFREAYNAEQILNDLADKVRTMVETGSVLEMVVHRISESLHVPRVAILLSKHGTFELAYGVGCSGRENVGIPEDGLMVQHLKKNPHLTVRVDDSGSWVQSAGNRERDSLEELQSELLLPLSLNQKLVGIMSLGPKQSEEPFTRTDIQLLDSVATQTGLALENSRLTAEIATEVAQRERMNRELEIAREVQERLFPQSVPSIAGIELAGFCRPALGVGGDYYDYFPAQDGDLGIAVGDVSGKGIPAALLMASLRASLRAQTMRGERDLAALMAQVNALVYDSSAVNKYATFFYAQYSPDSRLLRYVNAGHEPPLIFRGANLIRLETGGPVVGLLPGLRYEQGELTLERGDVFIGFSDGISEAMNPADEEWGVENLVSCVRNSGQIVSSEMIHQVMASADAFVAGAKQHDDMTIVVARIV
jgi:sigma-B regulation protein RsbU (phosphoserine phosphatase)